MHPTSIGLHSAWWSWGRSVRVWTPFLRKLLSPFKARLEGCFCQDRGCGVCNFCLPMNLHRAWSLFLLGAHHILSWLCAQTVSCCVLCSPRTSASEGTESLSTCSELALCWGLHASPHLILTVLHSRYYYPPSIAEETEKWEGEVVCWRLCSWWTGQIIWTHVCLTWPNFSFFPSRKFA